MSEHGKIKLGYDVAEVNAAFSKMQQALSNAYGITNIAARLEAIEDQRRQERWRTDPMGLMGWLDPVEWRWLMVERITDLADALDALAGWIEPRE